MTIEKFLSFWSQHNTVIIEGLIALVILLSLFLAYRSFFGKKSEGGEGVSLGGGVNIDAGQLEKTLQKILENQSHGAKNAPMEDFSVSAEIDEGSGGGAASASAGGEAASAEVAQLRSTLTENAKKMEILKTQLAQAQEQVTAANTAVAAGAVAGATAGAAAPAGGISTEERDEMSAKLRDLEARLAEYEIISEDIADLSRYREENDDLRKQIDALKSTGPVSAAPTAEPTPTPAAAPEVAPAAPELAAVPEPEPEAVPEPTPTPDLAAEVAAMAPPPEPASTENSLIDDDLMKEFAAAVEGQKALDKAAEKAGDGSEKAKPKSDDTDKLMDQFENFVGNKKS